jgi:hypothetical protein
MRRHSDFNQDAVVAVTASPRNMRGAAGPMRIDRRAYSPAFSKRGDRSRNRVDNGLLTAMLSGSGCRPSADSEQYIAGRTHLACSELAATAKRMMRRIEKDV